MLKFIFAMLIIESKAIMKIRAIQLLFFSFLILCSCQQDTASTYSKLQGRAFGTSFQMSYKHNTLFDKEIDDLFMQLNHSLSTYIPDSDISKINKGDTTVIVDALFQEIFEKSSRIYRETDGVFDPTIGILVNAWGFGPEKTYINPDSNTIKKLITKVGFDKVSLVNNRIKKRVDSMYFDFNAIAKGFALDMAGRFLESKGVNNYLIEIGGEIRTRGVKQDGTAWKAGIEQPNFDGSRSIQKIVSLKDVAMATSGSYRKFRVDSLSGQKFVHILDTKSGYTIKNNILSVSVIAALDCADVDAYATALMAMPLEKAKQFLTKHQELRAYIIFSDAQGNLQSYSTPNF